MRALDNFLLALAVLLFSSSSSRTAMAQLGPGASIEEDTGQVAINAPPLDSPSSLSAVAMSATIFSSVPGPKDCRGRPVAHLTPPQSSAAGVPTAETCFDLAAPAGCAVFLASKEAGCEARLFAESACVGYLNTAVFMPERRPVGGSFRSVGLRCGVPAPDPASLGAPPLAGMFRVHEGKGEGSEGRRV